MNTTTTPQTNSQTTPQAMQANGTLTTLLEPLLTPDQVQLTAADRRAALGKLDSAARQGALSPSAATDRGDRVLAARTRGELRMILADVPGATPPSGLLTALRVVSGVWLVACVVQFVVWLALAMSGHLDSPWWLWSDIGLGAVVAMLWWGSETYHRKTDVVLPR
jgi:hypothetical protein